MDYEYYLKKQTSYIHHALENVINVLEYQQVNSLGGAIESIPEKVSIISIETIIQDATDKILSRESIRQMCYDIFLWDENIAIGTTEDVSYSCRSIFTVRRLKEHLEERTLHEIAETLRSQICRGISKHFECSFSPNLEQNFSDLKIKISDELFEKISSVVLFIVVVAFNNPLFGIIVAATTLVGTFIRSINVTSTDWRVQIADGIYETIVKSKTNILSNIEGQVKNICWPALQEGNEVSDTVTDWPKTM